MTLAEWIRNREIRGQMTFSVADVRHAFSGIAEQSLSMGLKRMTKSGRIQSVYRGFYVIVPPQYALKGVIPPSYYLDDLMTHLGKPYYVCLLSAAAIIGASHQRVMQTQVMTIPPRSSVSEKKQQIAWNYRQQIPIDLLLKTNTEIGVLYYSCAELTAVDLVQYAENIGGYQRAATVLSELADELRTERLEDVFKIATTATIQRLGAILEDILGYTELANQLYLLLQNSHKVLTP